MQWWVVYKVIYMYLEGLTLECYLGLYLSSVCLVVELPTLVFVTGFGKTLRMGSARDSRNARL